MTLATEQPDNEHVDAAALSGTATAEDSGHHINTAELLEKWSANERMRHIPSLPWIVDKLDHDLRRRIELLWTVYANDPQHPNLEKEFRGLCRCLDRVANVAKRMHGNHHNHPPAELGARIRWAINHAVSLLNGVDAETFGHRYPFQTFERSNAEPLWAAMLAVIEHVHRITSLVRPLDPGIDERMYEGLVTLQTPLDSRPLA
jgi:hypothetical protein